MEESSQLVKFNYGVFILSTIALFCLINIIGYALDKTTKYNVLIPGETLKELLSETGSTPTVIALPARIPLIAAKLPKLYKSIGQEVSDEGIAGMLSGKVNSNDYLPVTQSVRTINATRVGYAHPKS